MSRSLLLFYTKCFLACMALLSAGRIVFILFNWPDVAIPISDVFTSSLYGLMVDSSVCSVALAICFLIASLFFFLRRDKRATVHAYLVRTFLLLLVFTSIIDIFYFRQFGTRLTVLALNIFHDTAEIAGTITDSFPVIPAMLALILVYACLHVIINRWIKQVQASEKNTFKFGGIFILSAAALSFLYVGPPFWRITGTFSSSLLNQASLNGVYSFLKSADQEGINRDEIPEHAYGDLQKALDEVKRIVLEKNGTYIPCAFSEFRRMRKDSVAANGKNVVIIILESFGSNLCGVMNDGKGFTPRFDEWSKNGLLFTDFYSNGPRTVQGLVSTVASFPAILGGHPIRRKGLTEIQTIGNIFSDNGYSTQFIHNGDAGFDDMDIFMKAGGFSTIVDKRDYPSPIHIESRGVSDEDLFAKAYDMIWKGSGKPKLSVLLSLTNHLPYEIPPAFLKKDPSLAKLKPIEQGMRYTDDALGAFLDKCAKHPEFSNTVFLILGDHAEMYRPEDSDLGIFHIPLLILNSGKNAGLNASTGSQVDIAPTALELVHLSCEHHFMGQNLLDSLRMPVALSKGYGNDVNMIWDNNTIKYYFEDRHTECHRIMNGRYLIREPGPGGLAPIPYFVKFIEHYLQVTSHVYRTGKHRVK